MKLVVFEERELLDSLDCLEILHHKSASAEEKVYCIVMWIMYCLVA